MPSTSRHGTGRSSRRSTTNKREVTTTRRNYLALRRERERQNFIRNRELDGGSRKNSRKVLCYTGIDSDKTGVHTP